MTTLVDSKKDILLEKINQALKTVSPNASQIVIPEGFHLKDIEHLNEFRDQYKSYFNTNDYADFVEYCNMQVKKSAICTIDSDQMQASVIFDRGTTKEPLHGQNSAFIKMKKMNAFKLIEDICSRPLNQQMVTEFFEDNAEYFSFFDDKNNLISCTEVCKRIYKMKVQAKQELDSEYNNFSQSQSTYESLAINSAEKPLPEIIKFTCEPYLGLGLRAFSIRLAPSCSGSDVRLTLSIISYEKHLEDMGQEFKEKLVESFKDQDIETYVGTFKL